MIWFDGATNDYDKSYRVTGPEEENVHEAFDWCDRWSSKGWYYASIGPFWHFEYEEDALMFALKWGQQQ